jgi:ribonuclease R
MESKILGLLGQPDYAPLNVPEMLKALHLVPDQQQELQRTLTELEHAGRIARIKGNRYANCRDADLTAGRIRMNRQGKGFLQPDEPGVREITIPQHATSTALNGDRVLVRRDVSPAGIRRGEPQEILGTVIRILERSRTQLVGTLQRSKQFLYVIPDDPRIPHDIYVPPAKDVGRQPNLGDKVVVELREWQSRHVNPEGEIIEVLGPPDAEGVDMLSVLRQYDLPLHFPKKVLSEAHEVGSVVHASDITGRRDRRGDQVITIDPDDAKDFDDALCLRPESGGQWRLWVHIADVSHYVKPGTALDEEARKRGNSTYLVDRVIPMLPEALSNELCSLKPDVDRLTKCVEFLISGDGQVLDAQFYPSVIRSKKRFTYGEVLGILQGKPAGPIEGMLHEMHQLAQKIRRARFKAGALELDFPENKIRLDEAGRVLRIDRMENDVSHQLVEEYMLLANEAVAARLMKLNRPAVYRVHEAPDERRLREYREEVLSHHVPCGNLTNRPEVQKLLRLLGTLPIGDALKIGFLRSLMRARYAVEPLGHYGLAKTKYTHFTSPIRRYSDLVVHRALFQKPEERLGTQPLKLIAEHISDTERNSADAERDSKDVKMFAFLEAQLRSGRPNVYPALVTDVRNFGFFVDVTGLGMSGLVPLSKVADDFYQFDEARGQLVGRRTRRVIKLGDRIEVRIGKVDRYKKQVDFELVQQARAQITGAHVPARSQTSRFQGPARREGPRHQASPRQQGPRPQGARFQGPTESQGPGSQAPARPLRPTTQSPTRPQGSRPQAPSRQQDFRSQGPRPPGADRSQGSRFQGPARPQGSRPQALGRAQGPRPQGANRPERARFEGPARHQGPRGQAPARPQGARVQSSATQQGSRPQAAARPQGSGLQTQARFQGPGLRTSTGSQNRGAARSQGNRPGRPQSTAKPQNQRRRWR